MWQHRLTEFVTLFIILDPAGVLPVFVALTSGYTTAQRRYAAMLAIFISFWVLAAFVVAGEVLLQLMGIPLRSFQIAGGLVMFLYALGMVLGDAKEISRPATRDEVVSLAVYPIAIPGIAGPGSILAVVLLTDNTRFSFMEQLGTVGVLAIALFIFLMILLFANPISGWIGRGGAQVLKRVMGLLLVAVAANTILSALIAWLGLPSLD